MDEERLREMVEPLLSSVVRLDWYNKPMDEAWYNLLQRCKNLDVINLSNAQISEEQVLMLVEKNAPLSKLNLYGVRVTDQIVPALASQISNGNIQVLVLAETQISPEGKSQLRAAIPKTTIID